jgi:hypothetical protein
MGASGLLNFSTAASVNSMTTGIWDFTTNANTIQYNGNYSATIPSYFTNFSSLTIGGTGTKTLGANTTVNGTLYVLQSGDNTTIFECSTYNLTVNGATNIDGTFSKNGAGNLLFVGIVNACYTVNNQNVYFLLSGNPNVEIRNGFIQNNGYAFFRSNSLNTGTGTWTFTTNNQNFNIRGWAINQSFNANILVSGAITVSYGNNSNGNGQYIFHYGIINGDNVGSKFVVVNYMNFGNTNVTPMATGTFDYLTNSTSIIGYYATGSLTLPYQTYNSLTIDGFGTNTKTLSGNTTIINNLVINNNNNVST